MQLPFIAMLPQILHIYRSCIAAQAKAHQESWRESPVHRMGDGTFASPGQSMKTSSINKVKGLKDDAREAIASITATPEQLKTDAVEAKFNEIETVLLHSGVSDQDLSNFRQSKTALQAGDETPIQQLATKLLQSSSAGYADGETDGVLGFVAAIALAEKAGGSDTLSQSLESLRSANDVAIAETAHQIHILISQLD